MKRLKFPLIIGLGLCIITIVSYKNQPEKVVAEAKPLSSKVLKIEILQTQKEGFIQGLKNKIDLSIFFDIIGHSSTMRIADVMALQMNR